MNYILIADILAVIDQSTLDDVTDNDPTQLDLAETRAIDEAHGYINVRYDAEAEFLNSNSDRHGIVVEKIVDIMLYNLHAKVSPDNIPELRNTRYRDALTWFEKLASGFINPTLAIKEDTPTTPLRFGSSSPKQNPYY